MSDRYGSLGHTIKTILEQRKRKADGAINALPSGLPRFSAASGVYLARKKYYLITGQSKSGKTTIADAVFKHGPLEYLYADPEAADYKHKFFGYYFNLEQDEQEKRLRMFSRVVYNSTNGMMRIDDRDLLSELTEIDDTVIAELKANTDYLDYVKDRVTYIEDARTVSDILEQFIEIAGKHGKLEYIFLPEEGDVSILSYEPVDPERFVTVYLDHLSLVNPFKGSQKLAMRMISKAIVQFRNRCAMSFVITQQQMELGYEAKGVDAWMSSTRKLADDKDTQRDANVVIGIDNPFDYDVDTYLDYKGMKDFGDFWRVIRVLKARGGGANTASVLWYDGMCGIVRQLPPPKDPDHTKWRIRAHSLRGY